MPETARPSRLGAFFGRVVRGDWGGAARAAAWPVGLLLAVATALAVPSYGQEPGEVAVGFADRLRIALALLLQSVGGDFEVAEAGDPLFGSGGGTGGGDGGAVSLVPLTVTVLWIVALLIGARVLRTRTAGVAGAAGTAGLEAAVRVALLVTAAVLVLGLSAQPTVQGVEVSSSPLLAALGALVLSLAVTAAAVYREDAAGRPAVPPAVRVLLRATGTAVRALAVVLVLCSLTAFVVLARVDGLDETLDLDDAEVPALLVALFLLPNLAVTALGLGWGAPVEAEGGSASAFGGGYEHESFGLAELGDAYGGWAVTGALALGTVCALTVGIMTARRCADRREQLLSAGVFFALFLLLAGLAGVDAEAAGGSSMYGTGGSGTFEAGPAIPETLLFGTLWLAAAVWAGPHLARLLGLRAGTPFPAGLPGPEGPASPAVPSASSAASVPPAPSMPSAPPVPSVSPVPTESVGAAEASAAGASGGADPGPHHRVHRVHRALAHPVR
ncbi:zinc ribbon domain-containing protein [Streptomyces apricus]|uniref:Zinc ribbon domain-containing protein n=1 Tax=Streptomyces apricus TaxID=1828112 RepID=A0A5B0B4S8_9ACTN|nr:zinc ribbon domain-containing protein [Streptomyces apricus]